MTSWHVNPRTALAMAHDIVAAGMAWAAAFWLRFNLELPPGYQDLMADTLPLVIGVQGASFLAFGLYRGIWRYASLHDLRVILAAVGVAAATVPALFVLLRIASPVPRSVFLLDPLLLLFFMGGSRLAYRAWKEGRLGALGRNQGVPILILGGGDAASTLIRELAARGRWRAVALLDDNDARRGRQIYGVPVRGTLDRLPAVAQELGVEHVVVAMPAELHAVRRRAVELATGAGLKVMTVPSFDDIASGRVTVSQLREVELDDLLGRDPVQLDGERLSSLLKGQVVMVTGAGGSIGSELCRQIARFSPARLVLFELSEFALYQIEQEFAAQFGHIEVVCAAGDVRNGARVRQVLAACRPQVVFHAAAYKHVPLMEQVNAWEAIQNNVRGTWTLATAAAAQGVEKFVLISTDKAVNPVNVMGASKRLAEMVCQALQHESATRFVMVRFGNVLGSAGSVIPKFRQQIAAGGPVTVTHPDITRYFMSIPEAAQLVLQAGTMGQGGEIFVLDMGEPVRIVDLARDMIRLSGCGENEIAITFTGLRPGEKLYEEVLADDEQTLPTPHPKLRVARSRDASRAWLEDLLKWLSESVRSDDEVRRALRGWVPEYRPEGAGPVAPAVSEQPPAQASAAPADQPQTG